MQTIKGDAGENFHSLDDIYYYGGQSSIIFFLKKNFIIFFVLFLCHYLIAVGNYKTNVSGEIELYKGDLIEIIGNHWNGFSKGVNKRTKKKGLFPSYLAKEYWKIVDFPFFNNNNNN